MSYKKKKNQPVVMKKQPAVMKSKTTSHSLPPNAKQIKIEDGVEKIVNYILTTDFIKKIPSQQDDNFIKFIGEKFDFNPQQFFLIKSPENNNYAAGECFENVRLHVEKNGGDIVYGWTVVEYEGLFFESEFHAVWRNSSGDLIDITPSNIKENMFFIDPTITYTGIAVPNKFGQITSHPYVSAWIHLRNIEGEIQKKYFQEQEYNEIPFDLESFFNERFNFQRIGILPSCKEILATNLRFAQYKILGK